MAISDYNDAWRGYGVYCFDCGNFGCGSEFCGRSGKVTNILYDEFLQMDYRPDLYHYDKMECIVKRERLELERLNRLAGVSRRLKSDYYYI